MRMLKIALVVLVTAASIGNVEARKFDIRGIKGLWWDGIEKYQLALPWLAEHDLNFLMLCYSSFPASGMDWRADYTPKQRLEIGALARQAEKLKVHLCLSFNPGIWSKPPLEYSKDSDSRLAFNKVKQIHALGVNWFALCLDDIGRELLPSDKEKFGTLQAAQVSFVNHLWDQMKTLKPRPKLIFCPSAYTTEDAKAHLDYIKTIGEGINKDVLMFWTGPSVCSASITVADANEFGALIRRKPFVWDNYPVNDMFPWRPLLSPVKNRASDLSGAVSGFLANPMKQWYISTIPLATLGEYLNNPTAYNPTKAIERVYRSYPAAQRKIIQDLVKLYGSSFWGEKGFPPQPRPSGKDDASKMLSEYKLLCRELSHDPALKPIWEDVQPTLDADLSLLERKSRDRLVDSPLKANGDDFEGGAGELFGYFKYERPVNYIYAKPSGRDEMHTEFLLFASLPASASLRLVARNADDKSVSTILILLNDKPIFEGKAPFNSDSFSEKVFPVPAGILKVGKNVLVVRNLEDKGVAGMPPWFMLSEAELIPKY